MGASFGPVVARPSLPLRRCDANQPVCIHADAKIARDDFARVRASAARAWGAIVDTLQMPPPLFDGDSGGDPRLDLYLARVADASDPLLVGRDAPSLIEDHDGAPAFLVVDPRLVARGGCELDATIARGVARACAMGLDVAETEVVVDGFSRYLSSLVAPCSSLRQVPFEAMQREPWHSLTDSAFAIEDFARFVDVERGEGYGALVPALLSMAIQKKGIVVPAPEDFEYGPVHFRNEPTVFDVMAATLSDEGASLDDLFLDAAVARVLEHPQTPPTFEWRVPVSTLPRRLAVSRGIEPTGLTFVRIDLDRAPKGDAVEIKWNWEQGSRFRWSAIKLDAKGRDVGRPGIPSLERAREQMVEVRHLDGVASVLVVGVNLGDPMRPWRPDDPPSPPHGYEIAIFEGE